MTRRSHFLSGLHYERLPNGDRRLTAPLRAWWHRYGIVVELPTGTTANGNSRPGLFRRIIRRWGYDERAVWCHDAAYGDAAVHVHSLRSPEVSRYLMLSRRQADALYLDLALACVRESPREGRWKRYAKAWLCFAGLRVGGWYRWHQLRKGD